MRRMPSIPPTSPSRRRLLASGLALAATGLLPRRAWTAPRIDPDADWIPSSELLQDLPLQMQALGVPGVGIAVVEAGKLAWSRGVGLADVERKVPVDDTTLFEVASMSKPPFAYVVLQLVDRGELSLDKPLVDYRRPDYLGNGPWTDRITARDVLRHSTGLPNWRRDPAHEKLMPAVAPGTRVDYSGEAFVWLQLVVETVTGESLDRTMRRLLFDPAGMRDSSYGWDAQISARSVHGYGVPGEADAAEPPQGLRAAWDAALPVAGQWNKPLSDWRYADAERALPLARANAAPGIVNWPVDILADAAASLHCTVRDYARFLALMVHPDPADWELRPETRDAMLRRQIDVPGRWTDKGLGWNIEATAL